MGKRAHNAEWMAQRGSSRAWRPAARSARPKSAAHRHDAFPPGVGLQL